MLHVQIAMLKKVQVAIYKPKNQCQKQTKIPAIHRTQTLHKFCSQISWLTPLLGWGASLMFLGNYFEEVEIKDQKCYNTY